MDLCVLATCTEPADIEGDRPELCKQHRWVEPWGGRVNEECVFNGCETSADVGSNQPDRCEYHHVTWGNVFDGECDCYQGVDNADVEVCGPHRRAYEKGIN
jgi:hypothetical protein